MSIQRVPTSGSSIGEPIRASDSNSIDLEGMTMPREERKPYAPIPDTHPLAESANATFRSAREGLEEALAYYDATDGHDTPRLRVALAGIVAACDAFKATANAYSNILGHVQRAPKGEP